MIIVFLCEPGMGTLQPMSRTWLPPIFVYKVVLEHSHACFLPVCGCFPLQWQV